jgi:hypothetical protein
VKVARQETCELRILDHHLHRAVAAPTTTALQSWEVPRPLSQPPLTPPVPPARFGQLYRLRFNHCPSLTAIMSSSTSTPPEEVSFGHGANSQKRARSPDSDSPAAPRDATETSAVPKPKRLACMICRKRKLKCDGVKPSCSTCARLGHSCAYDEVRRKSGPKRGYVKALEERLSEHPNSLVPPLPKLV